MLAGAQEQVALDVCGKNGNGFEDEVDCGTGVGGTVAYGVNARAGGVDAQSLWVCVYTAAGAEEGFVDEARIGMSAPGGNVKVSVQSLAI